MSRILSPIPNYYKLRQRLFRWIIYHRFAHIILAIFLMCILYIQLGILADQKELELLNRLNISIVRMVDVGQGDGFEIILPTGNVLFVDIGQFDQKFIDGISSRSTDYLSSHFGKKNFLKSDLVFLTHDDADHAGALLGIAKKISIGALVTSPFQYSYIKTFNHNPETDGKQNHEEKSSQKTVRHIKTISGQEFGFGNGFILKVLSPELPKNSADENRRSANDDSLVFKMNLGSTSIMFTGDASELVEKKIIEHLKKIKADRGSANNELKSDILKVGHHGSKTSTSDSFLDVVDPHMALISAGRNNRYKHPAKPIIKKLEKKNIEIARTDICGQVDLYAFPGGAIGRSNSICN